MKLTTLLSVGTLLLLGWSLVGCAVTSGSTFDSVIASVEAGSVDDAGAPDTAEGEAAPPLRVESDPDDADVFIDGRLRGVTPLDVDDIEPGSYLLTIEKDGYREVRRWIDVPRSGSLTLEIALEEITGYLRVDVVPAGATIRANGDELTDGFAELPIGRHRVHVELFGYRPVDVDARIDEDEVTVVAVDLEPAPFELDDLSTYRRAFSPENPGRLGTTLVSYTVTAPGAATLAILDDDGTVVLAIEQGPFHSWDQEYRWDGTDETGRFVADGRYTVEVTAVGDDGRFEDAVTSVIVDRTLVVRFRSIWGATSGLLFAPTPDALPAGSIQVSSQVAGIVAFADGRVVTRFPGRLGARFGLGAGFELVAYGGFIAHSQPLDDRGSVGGAVMWDGLFTRLGRSEVGVGVATGGVYQSGLPDGRIAGPDTQANYPGLFVSVPLSLGFGSTRLVVAPEYRVTAAPVVYGSARLPANSWGSIGYLRGGLVSDFGGLTLGASAAMRTTRFDEGVRVDLPFQTGAEVHWIVPGSSVALGAFLAAEVESLRDLYVISGLGIGMLF